MSDEPANDDRRRLVPEAAARPPRPRRAWGLAAALLGAALAGAAVSAAVFVFKPTAPPPAIEPGPERPVPSAETPAPAPAVVPPGPEPSRARGRADWLFFFKAGDQLVRMGDDAPIGLVIRTVPKHSFADGTVGPAYLVQIPDGGGQRFVDADELERGGRLQ